MLTKTVIVQIPSEQMNTIITFFIKKANEFTSQVTVARGEDRVNAKSLLGLLSMRLERGTELILSAEGSDAAEALASLTKVLEQPAA